jgi:hypothetical protein
MAPSVSQIILSQMVRRLMNNGLEWDWNEAEVAQSNIIPEFA